MAKHGSRSQMATIISHPCDSMMDLVLDGFLLRASEVAQCRIHLPICRRCRFDPRVMKIPCRRKWPPTPVLLPGWAEEVVGYSFGDL